MNISGITPSPSSAGVNMSGGGDNSSKIKALESRLQQLNDEKKKAVQAKDEEAKKKIEKQIQEIKNQIEQLKRQSGKRPEEAQPKDAPSQYQKPEDPTLGNYIDDTV